MNTYKVRVFNARTAIGIIIALFMPCTEIMAVASEKGARTPTVRYGSASWYGGNAKKERLNEYTASGRRFNPNELGCAIYGYSFGSTLLVTNLDNGKSITCTVWDRGPNKRLGRLIDLYREAFSQIADLRKGVIDVSIRETL